MSVAMNPYLNFKRDTREAMTFYHEVFGGALHITSFKDGGMPTGPDDENLVMHASLDGDNGIRLMASDTPPGMDMQTGSSISISLSGTDEATLRGYWDKLSAGGTVTMPLEKAPWGDTFGMCVDRFQTPWMVNITGS